jgi:hypothetical protein
VAPDGQSSRPKAGAFGQSRMGAPRASPPSAVGWSPDKSNAMQLQGLRAGEGVAPRPARKDRGLKCGHYKCFTRNKTGPIPWGRGANHAPPGFAGSSPSFSWRVRPSESAACPSPVVEWRGTPVSRSVKFDTPDTADTRREIRCHTFAGYYPNGGCVAFADRELSGRFSKCGPLATAGEGKSHRCARCRRM